MAITVFAYHAVGMQCPVIFISIDGSSNDCYITTTICI